MNKIAKSQNRDIMSAIVKATDCKCIICGKPAVAFFPVIDPDIPSHPYCAECIDKAKLELAIALWGDDEEMMKASKAAIKRIREKRERRNDT